MQRYIAEGIARDGQAGKRVAVIVKTYDTPQSLMAQVLEHHGHGKPDFNAFSKINYTGHGQVVFLTDTDLEDTRGLIFDVVVKPHSHRLSQFVQAQRARGAEVLVY